MFRRVKETNYLLWIQTKIEGQLESLRFHRVGFERWFPTTALSWRQVASLSFYTSPKTAGTVFAKPGGTIRLAHDVVDYGVNEVEALLSSETSLSISSVDELKK